MRSFSSTTGYRFNGSLCRYTAKSDPDFDTNDELKLDGPAFTIYPVLLQTAREELFTEHGPKPPCAPYILRLYGSSKRLAHRLRQLRELFSGDLTVIEQPEHGRELIRLTLDEQKIVSATFSALYDFDVQISNLNSLLVELHYPGLSLKLESAPAGEDEFPQFFEETVVPKYALTSSKLTPWLLAFLRSFETYWGTEVEDDVLGGRYYVENDPRPLKNEYRLVSVRDSVFGMCDTLAEAIELSTELLQMSQHDDAVTPLDRRLTLAEERATAKHVATTSNTITPHLNIGSLEVDVSTTCESTIPDVAISVLDELRDACQTKPPSPTVSNRCWFLY